MAVDPRSAAAADASALSRVDDAFGFNAPSPPRLRSGEPFPPGSDLGGVTIVRLLAEGGMGRVYVGRQAAPDRIVAVKVLRAGLGSADLVRRFHDEARMLARLHHPSIAQIYTVGTHDDGAGVVPFFVMELVEAARPITRHAVKSGLDVREIVALLQRVCGAVAHGHQKGVIHRDLKPGNILVDGDGQPKVIDFGVARSIEPGREDRTQVTRVGDMVGTLRYMSPEQVDGGDVDARSDVYALGLVIHEAITGRLPYDLSAVSFVDAVRILGDPEPVSTEAVARAARGSGSTSGDARSLATIVSTCLAKEPTQRYATAAELEAELGRWLAGEAILARPPTGMEAAVRFARRHRAATVAAAAVLVALVAAAAFSSVFYLRAERQRALAEDARRMAERREREAERQAAEARGQLYVSNLLLAAAACDRDNVPEGRRLLNEARALSAAADADTSVELACVAASLDDAVEVVALPGGAVTAVGWSTDGTLVACGADDGGVRLGHVAEGVVAWDPAPLGSHEGRVWSSVFSPGGDVLATAGADGLVRIWSVPDRRPVTTLGVTEGATYATAFSPDGRLLATGGRDRVVRVWSTDTWQLVEDHAGHEATVLAACFIGDGGTLATSAADGGVRIWEMSTGGPFRAFSGHEDRAFGIAAAPDGTRLATCGEDGFARIWDVATGAELLALRHPFRVNGVAWVGSGDRVATACADGVVRVWDAGDGRELRHLRGHAGAVWSVAAAPGTGRLGTGGADGTVRLWDADGRGDPVMPCEEKVHSVACAPDGSLIATSLADATVRLWDAATLEPVRVLRKAVGRVSHVAFSPDGAGIAGGCEDGTVQVWTVATGKRRAWLKPHDRRVYSVDFSPDGTLLATAAEDRSARIWDLRGDTARGEPLRHGRRVFSATFSPDGAYLATACEDRTARLWRVADGTEVRRFEQHEGPVNWVAFSPSGDLLVTACSDGAARIWRVADGGLVATLTGPVRQMWKAVFSPDGRRVAAVSADGSAQLWEVGSGRALPLLRGHTDQAWGVAFSPDGKGLVTGSWDGTARLWGVSVAELAHRRCGR